MSNLKAKNYDITSLILVMSLITIGLINIYSVSYSDLNSIENFFSKQVVFVLFSFAICLSLLLLDINFYFKYASIIYISLLVILILLLFFGKEINGAKSWFNIMGISLQPSEIMKFVVHALLAWYLASRPLPPKSKHLFWSAVMIAIPAGLIVLQIDTGTAIMVFMSGVFVILLAGIRWRFVFAGLLAGLLG